MQNADQRQEKAHLDCGNWLLCAAITRLERAHGQGLSDKLDRSLDAGLHQRRMDSFVYRRVLFCADPSSPSKVASREPSCRMMAARPSFRGRSWRVAPVSAVFPNPDEGAPGPSLLGTGDSDTMQAMTTTRVPDTSTTTPAAWLFSAASGHPSISTGKERDTESGNDYFGARYYGGWRTHPVFLPQPQNWMPHSWRPPKRATWVGKHEPTPQWQFHI